MHSKRSQALLLLPAVAVLVLFLVVPLVTVLNESFRTFQPGRIGSVEGSPLTLQNYSEILLPVYARYFFQTYVLAFSTSILTIVFAFPLAYFISRVAPPWARKTFIFALIGLMFLSAIVRIYSIQLTFGSTGIVGPMLLTAGINTNGRSYTYFVIIVGLLQYTIPMSILVLMSAVQNLNPRLNEVAQSLGASVATSHLTITIPLCLKGLISAFLVSMTFGISAFAIPLILGRGKVLFVSNLIYSRFSEVANFPSGAAISIVMMVLSLALVFIMSRLSSRLDRT